MATYVIGDVHGCYQTLQTLLEAIAYDRGDDELWLVGDLVNNGPRSAEVVRWAIDQGDRLVCVLGNHDLHLLAVEAGARELRHKDTFTDVLEAPDGPELMAWLRQRPVLHRRGQQVLVHAGLLPQWTWAQAEACARELEEALRGEDPASLFTQMYGDAPRRWDDGLTGADRLRLTVNALTRMRAMDARTGALDFDYKGTLGGMPQGLEPWFVRPRRAASPLRVFFGHWSAIGPHTAPGAQAMDSGCTWGHTLSAWRIEDDALTQVPCAPGEAASGG